MSVTLTDKYPHPQALRSLPPGAAPIVYLPEPVDATRVPSHLRGMRTLFEGFHHFRPEQARAILRDAAEQRAAIGVFEASLAPPLGFIVLLLSPLMTLLAYLALTPFLKPRTLARFLWACLLPVVPLAACWDGVASLLPVYSPGELRALTADIACDRYAWEIGRASTGTALFAFTYLLGYPV